MFGLLASVLLVGQQLHAPWAGGDGRVHIAIAAIRQEGAATVDRNGTVRPVSLHESIRRGEVVRTDAGGRMVLQIGFCHTLALDENTDVRLDDLVPGTYRVHLARGRAYLDTHLETPSENPDCGPLTITTNKTETAVVSGKLAIVNYDFKQTVGIAPVDTVAAVVVGSETGYVLKSAVEITETDPPQITDVLFDPTSGAAAEFYAWATQ